MQLDKLPPWALPVGIGGIAGVAVLLTRHKSSTIGPIPITTGDTTTDTTDPNAWFVTFGQSLTDLISSSQTTLADTINQNAQTQQQNEAQFLQNFTSLQSGTVDQFTQLITAQQQQTQAGQSALQALITQFQTQFQTELDSITQLVQHPPTTGATSLIDWFKQRFSTAFQRITSPPGTAQPNSDITTGTLVNAPYAQDRGFTYYDTTGQLVTGPFRQFLGNFGGARTWGRPLSQVFRDTANGFDTQVFEHAIFRYIPNSDPTHYDIVVEQI
jgi:hypothetical protein